ncbi:MAG TPA: ABC transporter permease [Firmicutes bacterium]|nr:ABC transporter permease [Bacillota bacterium]
MRFSDTVSIVVRNLKRSKTRTTLTSLGVLIGVAAIITLVSIGIAMQTSVTSQFESVGDLTIISVYPSNLRLGPFAPRKAEEIKILDEDAIDKIRKIQGIEALSPVYTFPDVIVKMGRLESSVSFTGIEPKEIEKIAGELEKGRYITKSDRYAVVVGSKFGETFYNPKTGKSETINPLGKMFKVTVKRIVNEKMEKKTYIFRIVGVLKEKGTQDDYSVYAPINTVISVNEWRTGRTIKPEITGYSRVIVKVKDVDTVNKVTEKIEDMGFVVFSIQSIINSISTVFKILQFILAGIAGISLLVAGIGIVNTMTMSIYERTRQIGIMKAIGASNTDILWMFLSEAAALGFLGGIGGILLSFLLNSLITLFSSTMLSGATLKVSAPLWLIIFAIVFATVVGLIAGLVPSYRAANLKPVEALRYE